MRAQTPNPKPQTPNPKPQTTQRFSGVDSLRAVACALVIISHVPWAFRGVFSGGEWIVQSVAFLDLGRLGVLMFFAISGFVIPSSLRGIRWDGFKAFAIRRLWRLYPPYWLVFGLSLCLFPDYYGLYDWDRVMRGVTMLSSFGQPTGAEAWTHFWTLEVELVFYIFVGGLFLMFGRLGWWVTFFSYLLMGVASAPYFLIYPISWNTLLPHLAVMFWGATCREVLHLDASSLRFWNVGRKGRAILLGLITAPLVSGGGLLIYKGLTIDLVPSGKLIGWGISLIIGVLGFLFWVILWRVTLFSWLATVGRWTYSTYLFHAIVLWGGARLANLLLGGMLRGAPLVVYMVLMLILCFSVGAVAYRWIEQPSDRIGKRLTAKRAQPD